MPRAKDTKSIAKRIDLHYFKKPHRWRMARLALVLLAVAVAGGWVAYAVTRPESGSALYNPGPVTAAHASFQNNCQTCHDADGKGGFTRSVSDRACLQCHEAPAHADNQLLLTAANAGNPHVLAREVPLADFLDPPAAPQAAADGEKPAAAGESSGTPHAGGAGRTILISANCTTCHFEHRGHAALAAVSNDHCTECHRDLAPTLQDPSKRRVAQTAITSFTATGHPSFGQELLAPGESAPGESVTRTASPPPSPRHWRDPTDLKFNHAKHLAKSVKDGVLINNCTACHEPDGAGPSLASEFGRPEGSPPFGSNSNDGSRWRSAGDGRYMRPVNFERHCRECHELQLPSGVAVAHADMNVVRGQLRDLEGLHYAYLSGLSPQQREKALGGQTPEQWVKARVSAVEKGVAGKLTSLSLSLRNAAGVPEAWKPIRDEDRANLSRAMRDSKVQPMLARDPNVLEYFVAYQAQVACSKCHTLEGTVPAAYVSAVSGQKLALAGLAGPAAAAPASTGGTGTTPPAGGGGISRPGGIRGPRAPGGGASETTSPPAEAPPQPAPSTGGGIRRPRSAGTPAPSAGESQPPAAAPAEGATPPADAQPQPPAQEETPAPAAPRIRRPGRPAGGAMATPLSEGAVALADPSARSALTVLQIRRPGPKPAEPPPAETPANPAPTEAATPSPAATTPPVAEQSAPSTMPAGDRFAGLSMLHTKPTGMVDVPRRWFANGRFDHQAHRNLSCVGCHAGADTSADTADVLSPDFDGRMVGLPTPPDGKAIVASESCLKCHGADQPNLPAGLSACITCHDYHQHQKEVWPAGRNVPRAKGGMTAKPAAADQPAEPAAKPAEPAA